MEVCFDCVLVLCFVMGYVLKFGEIANKRVHYYEIGCEGISGIQLRSAHMPRRLLLLPSLQSLLICVGYFHCLHLCFVSSCSSWIGLRDGVFSMTH